MRRSLVHPPLTLGLAFVFSCFTNFGWCLHVSGDIEPGALLAIGIIAGTLFFDAALLLLWHLLDRYAAKQAETHAWQSDYTVDLILATVFVCLCWIAVWLAAWPGYYAYDTSHFYAYIENGTLSSQQSIFHTMLVGNIIRLGMSIFGSYNSGVALYVAFQIVVCLMLVWAILRLARSRSRAMLVVSALFFGLNPSISMFVVCSTKDVLFSVFLVGLCLVWWSVFAHDELSKSRCLLLLVLSFLVVAERNNGLYALMVAVPFIAYLLAKPKGVRIAAVSVCACIAGLVLGLVWNGPVARSLGATKANSINEMISIPVVQMARAASVDPSITSDDFGSLAVDLGILVSNYTKAPDNSDATRPLFWGALNEGKLIEFIKVWASLFSGHLGAYCVAPLVLTESAWSPFAFPSGYNSEGAAYDYDSTDSSVFAACVEEPAHPDSKLPWLANLLWHYSRDNPFKSYLPFAWTCSVAFYVWLLLTTLIRSIMCRYRAGVTVCIVLFCVALTSLLRPVVLLRYYWYLYISAPVLLCLLLSAPSAKHKFQHFA